MAQPSFSLDQFIQRTPGPDPFNLINYGPVGGGGGGFGAGAGELPDWMKPFVPIDVGGGGGASPAPTKPAPTSGISGGEFLIRMPTVRPPDPKVVEQTPYLQPINENPFQGQLGGASGEGDSVQMPGGMTTGPAQVMDYGSGVVGNLMQAPAIPPPPEPTAAAQVMNYPENSTGWVPPIFPNDGKDGNVLEKAKYWLDGQSDGGVLKDIAAAGAHGLNYLLTPELASRGGGMLGNAINPYAGAAGALLGGMVGEDVIHPWVGEQIDKWANPRADPGMWGDPDNTAQQEAAMAGQIPNISIPNAELRSPEAKPDAIPPPPGVPQMVESFDAEGNKGGLDLKQPFGPTNPDANEDIDRTFLYNDADGSQTRVIAWKDGSRTTEYYDKDGNYQGATELGDDFLPANVKESGGEGERGDQPPPRMTFETGDFRWESDIDPGPRIGGVDFNELFTPPSNLAYQKAPGAANDFGLGDFFNKDYGFDVGAAPPLGNKTSPDAWRDNLLWTQSNSVDRLMSEWEKFLKDREEHEERD